MRNRIDRLLHRWRHRRVRATLSRRPRPRSILVVCHGNICRSPYLAAVLQRALPDVDVASAGFVGPGRKAPAQALALAARRGLDLSTHRSQLVSRSLLEHAELLIAMTSRQASMLVRGFGLSAERVVVAGDLDPEPGETRGIPDPWNQPLEVFEASFARLDRCAEGLVTLITPRA